MRTQRERARGGISSHLDIEAAASMLAWQGL